MFENELNDLLLTMTQTVNRIIPVEWQDFYLNVELNDGDGEVLFYYNEVANADTYHFSHDIPNDFGVSLSEYMVGFNQLMDISRDIQELYRKHQQPLWYSMYLSVKSRSKLNVDFDYTNWFSSDYNPHQRLMYFRYKYLNSKPINTQEQELFDKMEQFQKEHN